ncbi:MAG TPA: hypothetical protein VHE55_07375 [Fimbriimonadaceae bacterium]|nr:hypothetical protein [Fimbriimonadaceae bacterium]
MPRNYAKRLAELLVDSPDDELTVDMPDDGFSDRVAEELVKMGFRVEREKFKPGRFHISRARPDDKV